MTLIIMIITDKLLANKKTRENPLLKISVIRVPFSLQRLFFIKTKM